MDRAVLDIGDCAFYLNVRERVVVNLVAAGKIPHRKIGKRELFIKADLDAWLQAQPGVSVKEALAQGTPSARWPDAALTLERPPVPAEASPQEPIVLKRGARRHHVLPSQARKEATS